MRRGRLGRRKARARLRRAVATCPPSLPNQTRTAVAAHADEAAARTRWHWCAASAAPPPRMMRIPKTMGTLAADLTVRARKEENMSGVLASRQLALSRKMAHSICRNMFTRRAIFYLFQVVGHFKSPPAPADSAFCKTTLFIDITNNTAGARCPMTTGTIDIEYVVRARVPTLFVALFVRCCHLPRSLLSSRLARAGWRRGGAQSGGGEGVCGARCYADARTWQEQALGSVRRRHGGRVPQRRCARRPALRHPRPLRVAAARRRGPG